MADDPSCSDEASRAAALLISGLMLTPDDKLAEFRRRRLGVDRAVPLENLRRLRLVLQDLAGRLGSDAEADWALVERMHGLITGERPPRAEPPPPPAPTAILEDELEDSTLERATRPVPDSEPPGPPGDDLWEPPTKARPSRGLATTAPALEQGPALASTIAEGSHLTLTEYAVLCATCGAFPARVRETQVMFSIDDQAARTALDDIWLARFDEHPQAKELWEALVTRLRAWLVEYGSL